MHSEWNAIYQNKTSLNSGSAQANARVLLIKERWNYTITNTSMLTPEITKKITDLIVQYRVMLFMKWTPESPSCWFSANAVAILVESWIYFESFDIYSNENIRQGIKQYSSWPTFPQLYIDGELIWWVDIISEMYEEWELDTLKKDKKL